MLHFCAQLQLIEFQIALNLSDITVFCTVAMFVTVNMKRKLQTGFVDTRVYPKVYGLAAWKWYSSLPLGAVVSLFCVSV
jgi:hypothetical protein